MALSKIKHDPTEIIDIGWTLTVSFSYRRSGKGVLLHAINAYATQYQHFAAIKLSYFCCICNCQGGVNNLVHSDKVKESLSKFCCKCAYLCDLPHSLTRLILIIYATGHATKNSSLLEVRHFDYSVNSCMRNTDDNLPK